MAPHATPTSVQRLALAGVAPEFASLPDCPTDVTVEDAITRVLGQDPDYVDDTTQENLLSSSAAWSRCHVYKLGWSRCVLRCLLKNAPCLKMTLLLRSCNETAQSDLKPGWPVMHGIAATLDCTEGSLET